MVARKNITKPKSSIDIKIPFLPLTFHIPLNQKTAIIVLSIAIILVAVVVYISPVGQERIKLLISDYCKVDYQGLQVAVFYPDPLRADGSDGAPYQDGKIQHKAFMNALLEFRQKFSQYVINNEPIFETYYFKPREIDEDKRLLGIRLIEKMKTLYYDKEKRCRIFLMTMSSAVEAVRPDFIVWRNQCLNSKKGPPILIATVASAPNLADLSNGIYRFYIRSSEESAQLAEYLVWAHKVQRCGVFYITRTEGSDDEAYGKGAKETFTQRWRSLTDTNPEFYDVKSDASNAQSQVTKFVNFAKDYMNTSGPTEFGVFIVGYGLMFKSTLDELISQGFPGHIACASTLTVPSWQPSTKIADDRIITVLPRCVGSDDMYAQKEHDVIYFFAKTSFMKILWCSATSNTTKDFSTLWPKSEGMDDKIHAEYLLNGDTIIPLEVVESDIWRSNN